MNDNNAFQEGALIERVAGRELDAEVAEKVMGWSGCDPARRWKKQDARLYGRPWEYSEREEWCRGLGHPPRTGFGVWPFPLYSTDGSASWWIVEYMKAEGWHVTVADRDVGGWYARFWQDPSPDRTAKMCSHVGDTAALAICLAALLALRDRVPPPVELP